MEITMPKEYYTLVVMFEAKPGKENELKELLTSLVAPTRKEPGCINYDFHHNPDSSAEFMFYENWADKKAHEQHVDSPHINACKQKLDALLAKPYDLSIWARPSTQ
jgi:quinol monooxygenase YgiN